MASQPAANPLVSRGGSSQLHVILHPLVLLTISDYIARHTLRQTKGTIIGALLGQQNGREITIEHAFEAGMPSEEGSGINADWFSTRLEQMKLVHKDRQLDFVGWFTLLPSSGPVEATIGTHRYFLHNHNESCILLAFHPEAVLNHSAGGQLPLTIYESKMAVEYYQPDEDKTMDDDPGGNGDSDSGQKKGMRFRELTYSVETEETEMIGMNYVAAGGGGATATAGKEDKPSRVVESTGQGKRRLVESEKQESKEASEANDDDDYLTKEEEEMVAALTTKSNAIKMLQSRIDLITKYLESLPPGFDSGEKLEDENMDADSTAPSLPILRQIQALVSRLDLIIPSDKAAFEKEMLQEANDVNLVDLLNTVMQSTDQAREVGKKFGLVEHAKNQKRVKDQGHHYGSAGLASMMNV